MRELNMTEMEAVSGGFSVLDWVPIIWEISEYIIEQIVG